MNSFRGSSNASYLVCHKQYNKLMIIPTVLLLIILAISFLFLFFGVFSITGASWYDVVNHEEIFNAEKFSKGKTQLMFFFILLIVNLIIIIIIAHYWAKHRISEGSYKNENVDHEPQMIYES